MLLRTDSAWLTQVSVVHDVLAGGPSLFGHSTSSKVAPCGSPSGLIHGGNYERRIHRPPSSNQTAFGGALCRGHQPSIGALPRMVSYLVSSLPGDGRDRPLRPDPGQSSAAPYLTRLGTLDPKHSPAARITIAPTISLPLARCQCHPRRAQGLALEPLTLRAHDRARPGTQRCHHAPRAARTVLAQAGLPHTAGTAVQPTASARPRGAHLSQEQTAALLNLCLPRRLRPAPAPQVGQVWRRLPKIGPFAPNGGRLGLPGRVLENFGTTRAASIRHRLRVRRLGTSNPVPVARHSAVSAFRHRAHIHPIGPTAAQWRGRMVQRVVPTPLALTALFQRACAPARTTAVARYGQGSARPAPAGWLNTRPVSAQAKTAEVASALCDLTRPLARRCWACDFHSAGYAEWQHSPTQPDVQGRQTSQGSVRQDRVGNTASAPNDLCSRPDHQALALSVLEILTHTAGP